MLRAHSKAVASAFCLLLVGLLLSASLPAVERVHVMALFPHKALLQIDGKRRLLKAGQRSPEGVLLVSADSREAVIEIDGHTEAYPLGSQIGGGFTQRQAAEVRIWADNQGGYQTTGSINGRMTDFLVDTGATAVAMSEPEARRLGIPYRVKGTPGGVNTASGYARSWSVMLDRVQVGEIVLQQVPAVVIEGNNPHQVLLGMTFLSRVKIEQQGNLMVLQRKY